MKTEKSIAGKIIAVGVIGLLAGATAGYFGHQPEKIVEVKEVEVPGETIVVPQIVEVNKTITLPGETIVVNNTELTDKVIDFVQDNFDEDIDLDYIVFELDAKMESEQYVKEKIVDLLEDEFDGGVLDNYREDEISIRSISEVEVVSQDFEDKDLVLGYDVKVKAKEGSEDAEYFTFRVEIPYEDGKMDKDFVSIELI